MAYVAGDLVGSKQFLMDFLISAALVAGQLIMRETTASETGEVLAATTTSFVDAIGVCVDAATYSTTPTAEPGALSSYGIQNLVRVACNPFQIIRLEIKGTAGGAALGSSSPANILTNTTADSSAPYGVITAAEVGTIDMSGGLVKGRTGNNAGAVRKLTTHSNNTSCTAAMGFVYALAAGDTFIRVPYSRAAIAVQLTTDLVNANGVIAYGTGCVIRVTNVKIDEQRDIAWVDGVAADHMYNSDSA